MPNEERNAWGGLIAALITFAYFGRRIWTNTANGTYSTADGLSFWAWDVIWLILGGIGIVIVTLIVFHILYAIIMRVENPNFVTDERDIMITRRGGQVTLFIISAGFIVAVGLLAFGHTALTALNTILVGLALGSCASEFYRLAVYRLGL